MALGRYLFLALLGGLLWAAQLSAQNPTGTITGRIVDGATQRPLAGANVVVQGTQRTAVTRADGNFVISGVPAGAHRVQASQIGYASQQRDVTVAGGGTATVQFAMQAEAVMLEELVAVGYGTQRREAVTGSVATVDADEANVGVVTNANEMIQGRVAGVNVTLNSGEPGAGAQIRIRGGTSISASNEPLYVIDGVPIRNAATEPGGEGVPGAGASLARNPLNLINPADIESISVLKDAAATAIYGSRGANGVVLIQTKKGERDRVAVEYDGYSAWAAPARRIGFLTGNEYRAFRQKHTPDAVASLGDANTDWERELTRTALTHNHNLSFSGGSESTQYRASLNYMDQEGVVISSGLERLQGRLNAEHLTWGDRLRLGLNLTSSHMRNDYAPYENTGGYIGGLFTNMAIFDPTRPVRVADPSTGVTRFFETGTGALDVRNPVALAEQLRDDGQTTRTLANTTAALELFPGVTANLNLGVDRSEGRRGIYFPRESAVGAQWLGRAIQRTQENTALTLQTFVTANRQLADVHSVEVVGGYEFADYSEAGFGAESRSFLTDAFGFNSLGGGSTLVRPYSYRRDHRLVSFFSRANYSLLDRYYLTGVLRYDGSSQFSEGNKWAVFPAISASWRISEEPFMQGGLFSDLRLRAGYGLQGNPGLEPYSSLMTLAAGGNYPFGDKLVGGMFPNRNPNADLRWEETSQFNVALDFGVLDNRLSGTAEYYVKNTSDLLLEVPVVQPAVASKRLENVGSLRNQGVELSLDAVALSRPNLTWRSGLVFTSNRNEVVDLGGATFIPTGGVSGEGQSGQNSQRILPGYALGTFFGPRFLRVDEKGRQVFAKYKTNEQGQQVQVGETFAPGADDYVVIGDANPDFTLGFRSDVSAGRFDFSFLVRSEVGRDVFNNTALVYGNKTTGGRNFLRSALSRPDSIGEPAIFSSRWIEDGSFVRLQNVTLGYTFEVPGAQGRNARLYVSGDNLLLLTGYSGYDPEVHTETGLASRGIDYLSYPRARTITTGIRLAF
jgi:TonB-linked SusC/RagA family outer membrane protein